MPFISEDRRETNRISRRKNKYRGNVLKEFILRSGIPTMSEFTVRKFGSSLHLPREEEEGQGGAVYTKGSSGNLSLRPQLIKFVKRHLIVEKTTVKSVKCLMNIRFKQCRAKIMTFIRM